MFIINFDPSDLLISYLKYILICVRNSKKLPIANHNSYISDGVVIARVYQLQIIIVVQRVFIFIHKPSKHVRQTSGLGYENY